MEEAEVSSVIARLAEEGAVDDLRFARRYAADKRELAGWGSERIGEALAARGLEAELIEDALAMEEEEEQAARAAELLAAQAAPLDTDAERGRALSLLARRGFPLEVAYEAIRRREQAA